MTGDEIRRAFLRFFEEKGHKVIPSSSLVPHSDTTLLLTSAGMVQIKPYFMGEATPPSLRLASCQKCFRTTDIESVGNLKHLTFFEMLGNFSVGDYFKEEAIAWAWEFVTKHLNLPPERLWVTIFLDDEEAFSRWREVGVPSERIVRYGEKDNFWGPAGESGPCGPCSELVYDFGEEFGCGKPSCGPACDCQRFLELWNLVFMQYYQDAAGQRTPLPKANIDTGMGLERTATVLQAKSSFYDTDLFVPIVHRICELVGRSYGEDEKVDRAIRIIAEHGRAVTFLVADGVIPSNEGRGYVLRRVLRRAALFGRKLGLEQPFLTEVARVVIGSMGHLYPEIVENRDFLLKVIELEQEKFNQTLVIGLNLLDKNIESVKREGKAAISGEEAFRLYDTYGFPKELTTEIAAENGLSVDLDGFEKEMARQRERARASHKFGLGEKQTTGMYEKLGILTTRFLGYERLQNETSVIGLLAAGEPVEKVGQGQDVEVILLETPFYGEMGGQVGDAGEIRGSQSRIVITDTVWPSPELIIHRGHVIEGEVSVGDSVVAEVDAARRLDIARNHTATHLLQAALRQVIGGHVHQAGSLVAPERLRFDFNHLATLSKEELEAVQHIINDRIRDNLEVTGRTVPYAQALDEGALALFGEKYGDMVRVVEIRGDGLIISSELCGGTHVARTGEIGFCQIVSESGIGAGMRRIEAVTGKGAQAFIEGSFSTIQAIAQRLQTSPIEMENKVERVLAELDSERRRTAALQRELSKRMAESLLAKAVRIGGVMVVAERVPGSNMETLRQIGDRLRSKLQSGVIVLATVDQNKPGFMAMVTRDLVAQGLHAGQIAKQVAGVTGGSGGGTAELGQGGGKDKGKLDRALRLVAELVQKR